MKKIIAIALCAALSLSFAACGGDAEDTTAADTTPAQTVADTTAADTAASETVAEITEAEITEAEVEILIDSDAATVDEAVEALSTLLDLLKAGDRDTIVALSGSDAPLSDELLMEMLVAMFEKLDYNFGTPVKNGNTAVVPADISAVNITSVFMEYMNEAAKHIDDETWDSDGSYFIEICKSDKVAPVTTQVNVNFELVDGVWTTAANNEELVNALFGGLLG